MYSVLKSAESDQDSIHILLRNGDCLTCDFSNDRRSRVELELDGLVHILFYEPVVNNSKRCDAWEEVFLRLEDITGVYRRSPDLDPGKQCLRSDSEWIELQELYY